MILTDNGKILMSPNGKAYTGNLSGGGSGKTIVHLLQDDIFEVNIEYDEVVANFSQVELNNKYIVLNIGDNFAQDYLNRINDDYKIVNIPFNSINPTNSTIYIRVPDLSSAQNLFFNIGVKNFIAVNALQVIKVYCEGTRLDLQPHNNCFTFGFDEWNFDGFYIKIDFDEFGIATIYLFDEYEV